MRRDYFAIFWDKPEDADRTQHIVQRARSELGFQVRLDVPGWAVLTNSACPALPLPGRRGIIVGDLFRRSVAAEHVAALSDADARQILDDGGQALIRSYWGEYIAFIAGQDPSVVRDPCAGFPGFMREDGSLTYFFSDVGILTDLDLYRAEVDWRSLHRRVISRGPRNEMTCLKGISEILAGTAMVRSNETWQTRMLWDPWSFAAPDNHIRNRAEAVEGLRDELIASVGALASLHDVALVELSGGLDSSIVSMCLASTGIDLRCTNLTTAEPGADEYRYALAVADRIGAPLKLRCMSAVDVDITDVPAHKDPWATVHPLRSLMDAALAQEAIEQGAHAFFSGSGGDYILAYLATSAPAADALIAFGPGRTFFKAASDVAALHRSTVWKAGYFALRKAWERSGKHFEPPPPLVRELLDGPDTTNHRWFPAPRTIWPGKVQQVTSIAAGHAVREGRGRVDIGPQRIPIWSQPVVEHCLRTPSWMSVHGGRNRAVARDAFADLLPDIVFNRRTKGDFTGVISTIYDRNRLTIGDVLSNGLLVENGILDQKLIEQYVTVERPPSDVVFTSLLQIASYEVWARSWREHKPRSQSRGLAISAEPSRAHA